MITQETIPYTADEINAMAKTCEKYNKALERAKYALTTDMDNSGHWAVNYIFPELKECDDKRIKREIVDCINAYANLKDEKIPTEWLDWLEGQCKNENRALPDEKRIDSAFTNIKFSPNLNKEESMNIQEDYCSYELCKLLKEKGFDEECEWYYPKDCGEREQLLLDELNYDYQIGNFIKCPSHALVMKWLREIYHLRIDVDSGPDWEKDGKIWEYCVCNIYEEPTRILTPKDFPGPSFTTYEEAVEAAIKDILVNLI